MSKPQLADDANLKTLPYAAGVAGLCKIDGVRALNAEGQFTGRSLKPFEGFGVTEYFSKPDFLHMDGEVTLGDNPTAPGLCRTTTGALGRFKGVTEMADYHWWLFDDLSDLRAPYIDRHAKAQRRVERLCHPRIHIIPYTLVKDLDHAMELYGGWLDLNYEGGVWRAAKQPAKSGRPDKHQQYMRSKPWQDDEMLCTGVTQGEKNNNEAKTNLLGHTERSSAKAGKVPNGEVGSIQGILLKDITHPVSGKVLLPKGLPITISTGEMTVKEAKYYWEHQDEIVNHIVKFRHFVHDVHEKPRMAQYLSHRLPQDM
jgi:DNA ligase 1